MERFVRSFYDGRCRIRHDTLKNTETIAMIEGLLVNVDGVTSVQSNVRVGSLLLEYDVDVLPTAQLMEFVTPLAANFIGDEEDDADVQSTEQKSACSCIKDVLAKSDIVAQGKNITSNLEGLLKKTSARKAINYSMLGSLALCLGLSSNKSVHVAAGGLFMAALSLHLVRNRKAL